MGSGRGRSRFPGGARGVGREGVGEGEEEGSVPDSRSCPRLRLWVWVPRPLGDAATGPASLRSRRRRRGPDERCSLSEAKGPGVEGGSCLMCWMEEWGPSPRSGRVSEVAEARD